MHPIVVPKLNNNDESCILQEWRYQNGDRVAPQHTLAILESSKATVDLVCEHEGILHRLVEAGDECKFGAVVGYIFAIEEERQSFLATGFPLIPKSASTSATNLTITRGALELIEAHNLTEADLLSLNKSVIKRSDVESLLGNRTEQPNTLTLSRRQIAIADVVSRSNATIPRAFLVMKVYCDQALRLLKQISARDSIMVGLPDLLVKITSGLAGRFPFFFGELRDDKVFTPASNPNVGVTFDVGKGLFIPVVKEPKHKSLKEIGETILGFRVKAIRDAFKQEDLSDGHITISLNTDRDVVIALPIVMPTQTCMISLGSTQNEVVLDGEQNLSARTYVNLGLAYDHRVINGHDAVQFLKAIKNAIESPEGVVE